MSVGRFVFRLALAIALVLICVPLLWLLLSAFFEPDIVLYQAKRIAGDRPYCIVVSDKSRVMEYREVSNRAELTYNALTTRLDRGGSDGPFAETYYSLLVLKNPDEIRNWSKRLLNFKNDVDPIQESLFRKDLRKLCTPVVNFAGTVR
jgi:hypothetical protein